MKALKFFTLALILFTLSCTDKFTTEQKGGYVLVTNEDQNTLGYTPESGVGLLTNNQYAFKDLNKNGQLDAYEDWRKSTDDRAKDLASKMSIEQIAGLMLYSAHQSIPGTSHGFGSSNYNGKPFPESGMLASDLSDEQKTFLKSDHLRHVLITRVESPVIAAQWNNTAQAYVEAIG